MFIVIIIYSHPITTPIFAIDIPLIFIHPIIFIKQNHHDDSPTSFSSPTHIIYIHYSTPTTPQYEPQEPSLRLFEIDHLLSLPTTIVDDTERTTLLTEAKKLVTDKHILYYLTKLFSTDAEYNTLSEQIKTEVDKKYADFDVKITEHEEAGSETDVLEVQVDRVKFACQIIEEQQKLASL